jgi:hypothetical protein
MSKTQRSPGAMLRVLLCAALLLTPVPRAAATPVEYDILFALILVVCLPALDAVDLPSGSGTGPDGNDLVVLRLCRRESRSSAGHRPGRAPENQDHWSFRLVQPKRHRSAERAM